MAPAERGWSSAPRARSRRVGCAILSESLRPALADQLVEQFAVASIVSERATQLLGCGAALCGRGVGRVRGPGDGLIVAGGVAASRRSRTRPLVSCCVPSLRALPLEEACELRIRPGRWRSLAPGKESVAKRSLACLAAMLQLGVLGGFPQVARKRLTFQAVVASASLARIRCFVMANCGRLRLGPECWSSVRTSRSSHPVVWAVRLMSATWMSIG